MEKKIDMGIQGTSMAPLISAEDHITLHLLETVNLKSGDIIAFWACDSIVVHRLIMKKRRDANLWLCQKGDNVSAWSWIPESEVLGRVEIIRGADRALIMSRLPWTVINPALGFALSLWIRVQERAQSRETEAVDIRFKAVFFRVGNEILRCTLGSLLGLL